MPRVIVAIPARDEAERIGAALAALAVQRDGAGAPLPAGSLGVLVYANNCRDDTAAACARWAELSPHPVVVVAEDTPRDRATAGHARKRAMDLAAERLEAEGASDGLILTTDADSVVATTWVAATLAAFARGVDAVAGYIDGHPDEIVALGPAFLRRGRLEDRYLAALAEIDALCDPRPHDPWPSHRVSSGASLAVTLPAYRAIGGLPPLPVGEDAALSEALEREGFRIRHAMDVTVSTSCRFEGRAPGGAADTMRDRHLQPDAPCDAAMERPLPALRRARLRGDLRRAKDAGVPPPDRWMARAALPPRTAAALAATLPLASLARCWARVEADSPALRRGPALRPSDLPAEIARAERLLVRLRRAAQARSSRSSR